MQDPYFHLPAPKTTGRERFGQDFVNGLIATGLPPQDLIATATELTAKTIEHAILGSTRREQGWRDLVFSGGGVHNAWLMRRIRELLPEFNMVTSDKFGIHPDAKEAMAFAMLAYESRRGEPGNLPSATGARHAAVLGKRTHR